ncbi:MAG: MBL fold metallo-hydrolase [Proteobacteria bacterium]|nr:MBL fold metallo-hydrolase [Pseudomonadota bacterium]
MTRRKFILSLLGAAGSAVVGFGTFDYVRNMKNIFESDYFINGRFRNMNQVDVMKKGTNFDTAKRWLFEKKETFPKRKFHFDADKIQEKASEGLKIMWTGHSSVYIEIEGKRFFCDPVWSMNLSPVGFGGPRRFFAPPLNKNDLPDLDGVLISHDHRDHLDKNIIKFLSQKGIPFYVPIGVDYILKSWGVPETQIYKADWYGSIVINNSIKLTSLPTVHFSGRGLFDKNKSQWTSWIIEGKKKKIYFGGDSGYHNKFKSFGEKYGPFDMTFLEIGAYDKNWDKIHLGPELAVRAHIDLRGKVLLPIHWGAYDLSIHPWKEPVERVIKAAEKSKIMFSLPKPGQLLSENKLIMNSRWWEA